MKLRLIVLLLLSFGILSCNALPDPIYTPKPLVSLKSNKVRLKNYWLDSVGIGDMWHGYNLRPALYNNTLVTADVEGWIRAFDVEKKNAIYGIIKRHTA